MEALQAAGWSDVQMLDTTATLNSISQYDCAWEKAHDDRLSDEVRTHP